MKMFQCFASLLAAGLFCAIAATAPIAGAADGSTPIAAKPRNLDYWRSHILDCHMTNTMILGGKAYTMTELHKILNIGNTQDQSVLLAQQMIACRMNFLTGCNSGPIKTTMFHAHSLLKARVGKLPCGVYLPRPAAVEMLKDAAAIKLYNEGRMIAPKIN
jgi:hypothetical protein